MRLRAPASEVEKNTSQRHSNPGGPPVTFEMPPLFLWMKKVLPLTY